MSSEQQHSKVAKHKEYLYLIRINILFQLSCSNDCYLKEKI